MSGGRDYASVPERITWTTGFRLPVDKHILGALSTFANFETGTNARMSLTKLTARAALNKRTVQRGLRRLEADGWIVASTRRRRHATVWNIAVEKLATHWMKVKVVGGVMTTYAQGAEKLDDSRVVQIDDSRVVQIDDSRVVQIDDTDVVYPGRIDDIGVVYPGRIDDTGVVPIPCTYVIPCSTEPKIPPLRGEVATITDQKETDDRRPGPVQQTFGPMDVSERPRPQWGKFADVLRTALEQSKERKSG